MTTHFDCGDPIAARRIVYAEALDADGEPAAAADLMRQALERVPDFAAGWLRLGEMLESADASADAIEAYRQALRLDGSGGLGAELKLARLGILPVPAAAPPAFVANLFDQYAPRFEASLVGRLGYRGPERLAEALDRSVGPDARFARTLDLGCGTGLMGERLRARTSHLTGLDLSQGMIAVAARKRIYDEFRACDLLSLGREPCARQDAYDCVTAADVLIYCGDLEPVFAAIASVLAGGGILAFSLERHDGPDAFVLRDSMRYAHHRAHMQSALTANGLDLIEESATTLRNDRGLPVEGLVVVARKPAHPWAELPSAVTGDDLRPDDGAPRLLA